MTRSYLGRGRLVQLVEQLSSRDLEIVETLATVRIATTKQLERLRFYSGTPLSNARQSRRVLRRLADKRIVAHLGRQIGGVRGGSAEMVWVLDVAGQRLAGGLGPARGRRVERPWTPSLPFVAHALKVTELYVRLEEVARTGELELVSFEAEPASWRPFFGRSGGRTVLKPDAFVHIGLEDYEWFSFVEVDMGTESPNTIARKLDAYRTYWASGREVARHGVFPKVVFLVLDDARRQQLVNVAARQPAEAWSIFQVVEFDEAVATLTGRPSTAETTNRPRS